MSCTYSAAAKAKRGRAARMDLNCIAGNRVNVDVLCCNVDRDDELKVWMFH